MESELFQMDREQLIKKQKELNAEGIYKWDSLINWLLMGM